MIQFTEFCVNDSITSNFTVTASARVKTTERYKRCCHRNTYNLQIIQKQN